MAKLMSVFLWVWLGSDSGLWISNVLSAPWARLNLVLVAVVIILAVGQSNTFDSKFLRWKQALSQPVYVAPVVVVLVVSSLLYTICYNFFLE